MESVVSQCVLVSAVCPLPAHGCCGYIVTEEENTGLPPFNCKQINLAVTKHTILYHHHQPKDKDKVQMIAGDQLTAEAA